MTGRATPPPSPRSSWERMQSLMAIVSAIGFLDRDRDRDRGRRSHFSRGHTHTSTSSPSHAFDIDSNADGGADAFGTLTSETCISGRFQIVRPLGRGGMGDVYEAIDLELGQSVALKTIRSHLIDDDRALARFRRELALTRRISHPNVCRTYDLGHYESDTGPALYLSMELLDGLTLEQQLAREGPYAEADARRLVEQIAAGLAAAHDAGVIHRDLKTANVMLAASVGGDSGSGSGSTRAVITDFGLARLATASGATPPSSRRAPHPDPLPDIGERGWTWGIPTVTHAGDLLGTPHFMAPEQVTGGEVGTAADIYALGVIMYRLVTGRYPFDDGNSSLQTMVRRLTDAPIPLRTRAPHVSPRWEEVTMACLARSAADRPASAREVMRMLTASPARRRTWRGAAIAAAAVVLTAPPGHSSVTRPDALPIEKRLAVMPFTLDAGIDPASAATIGTSRARENAFAPGNTNAANASSGTVAASSRAREYAAASSATNVATSATNATSSTAAASARALADGISESVSSRLARLRQLDPHLSSVPFADLRSGGAETIAAARRMFGVNLAVTGTVRPAGRQLHELRVALQLVDASTGRQLRRADALIDADGHSLTRSLADLLDLDVDLTATPSVLARIDTAGAAVSPAPGMYEFYTRGKGYLIGPADRDTDAAIGLFRRALEIQPRFALAQAGLATAYARRYQRTHDPQAAELAERAAADALKIDPSLAAAYVARGMVLRQSGRRGAAVDALLTALRLDAADTEALGQLAGTYDEIGDPLRAEETFQRAIRANPGYWVGYNNLGRFYLRHRQLDKAREQFVWATELAPDNPRAQSNLGGLLLMIGRYDDARAALQRAYDLGPTAAVCSNLGTAFFALGDTANAIAMYERAVAMTPRDHRYRRNLGDAFERAGRLRDARTAWSAAAEIAEAELRANAPGTNAPSANAAGTNASGATAEQFATAALYRAKIGDAPAARRLLASARIAARADDPGVQLKIAQALELIGDRRLALDTLTRAATAGLALSEIEQSPELARLRLDARYLQRKTAWQTKTP